MPTRFVSTSRELHRAAAEATQVGEKCSLELNRALDYEAHEKIDFLSGRRRYWTHSKFLLAIPWAILIVKTLAISLVSGLVLGLGMVMPDVASAKSKIYWALTGDDKIQRANLDGSGVEDLVTGLDSVHGIAIDAVGGKMYWADAGKSWIQRANLDGSDVENLITHNLELPTGIALDVPSRKMYWTDLTARKIQRANLDGSQREDLITTGLNFAYWIALDVAGGKMYWTDSAGRMIRRANLDGSGIEDLVSTIGQASSSLHGIALDIAGGKMYWADRGQDAIRRADLDGSNIEDVITTGLDRPRGLALDLSAGRMYWTHAADPQIQRAYLNGSGVEPLASGLSLALGIALGPDKPLVHGIPALGRAGALLLCVALFATAAIFGRSRR